MPISQNLSHMILKVDHFRLLPFKVSMWLYTSWLYITQTEKYSQTATLCAQYNSSKQCSRNMLIHVHVYPFFLFEQKLYYWYNFSVIYNYR